MTDTMGHASARSVLGLESTRSAARGAAASWLLRVLSEALPDGFTAFRRYVSRHQPAIRSPADTCEPELGILIQRLLPPMGLPVIAIRSCVG